MADLDEFALAKLAREMAMNIRPYKAVFADFGIDETEYYEIEKIEFYKRAKDQFAIEWNSSLSATERVKLISAAYLEQVLPVIGAKALNREENLPAATEVAKFLARNAGIGDPKQDLSKTAERFVITINLGGDVEKFDKSIAVDANDVGVNGNSPVTPARQIMAVQAEAPAAAPAEGQIDFFDLGK